MGKYSVSENLFFSFFMHMYMEKSIGTLCRKEVKKRLRGKNRKTVWRGSKGVRTAWKRVKKNCVLREQKSRHCMERSKGRLWKKGKTDRYSLKESKGIP